MSTSNYNKNPNIVRRVSYRYFTRGEWHEGSHVCYEKTDDLAVKSCYENILLSGLETFHITEIRLSE